MKKKYKILVGLTLLLFGSGSYAQITYNYTGDVQTYVVPPGVTLINIEAYGAQGGTATNDSSSCDIGGRGGSASGDLVVTPGETLYIYVGGRGYSGNRGGWNGGGSSCSFTTTCAKGGGASDVRQGGMALTDRVIVAGGGGGAEWSGCSGQAGGGGGLNGVGGAHPTTGGRNGGGGSQVAGGVAGVGGYNGAPGEFGIGGEAGAHPAGHSASGGGGWYGGGGSAEDGHAGGGSSYIDGVIDGVTSAGVQLNHGQIIITELCGPITVDLTDDAICLGESFTLEGTGIGTISWDGGVENGVPFTPATAGIFTYTSSSDDAGDCGFSVDVEVYELPIVTLSVSEDEICAGETVVFTAGGGVTYEWLPADIVDGDPYAVPETGTYSVVGIDDNGCENTAELEITVNELPIVTATVDDASVCDGDAFIFTGGGAETYNWDMDVIDGVEFVAPIGTATYTVTGVDANGCTNTAEVEATVHPLPTIIATASEMEVCFGEEVTFAGEGGTTYSWDNDVIDGTPKVMDVEGTTTYTVVGTDDNGCENTASVDVNVWDEIVVTFTTGDEIGGGDGSIDISIMGGAAPYTIDWDNDGTGDFDDTEDLSGLVAGTYTVNVMDDNGCIKTVEILVNSQVGILGQEDEFIRIYPNPATDQFTIELSGNYRYELTAINGAKVLEANGNDVEIVNIASLASGTYILKIFTENGLKTIKVIKQ